MMKICLGSHKGGVGKTTTSINLGAGLAHMGKRVLIVDMDPQGHSTLGLGIDIGYEDKNITDVLKDRGPHLKDIIRPTKEENLFVAPSNNRLAIVSEELITKIRREERLLKALEKVRDDYDFCIIDSPPSFGVLTANSLLASDLVLIPCEMSARAIDGLSDYLDLIELIKGEDFDSYAILVTKYDTRTSVTNDTIMSMMGDYSKLCLETKINLSQPVNQAHIAGESVLQFSAKSKGAEDYLSLAKEILSYVQ